jgi:hypothetical protein
MPKIIGKSTTVVQVGGLTINELAGNVATHWYYIHFYYY